MKLVIKIQLDLHVSWYINVCAPNTNIAPADNADSHSFMSLT
jgi:hypothetical protein